VFFSHSLPSATRTPLPTRRRVLVSALGLAGASSTLALTGCGGLGSEAHLRFINATVDYTQADFYAGSTRLSASLANGGTISSWYSVEADSTQVSLYAAGGSSAKLSETRTLDEDSYTTLLAYGSLANSLKFKFFAESNSSADSGKTKVRLFHAAENLGGLDLYITNTSSLSGLSPTATVSALGELSDFVSVTAGIYRVRLTSKGDSSNVLFDFTNQISLGGTAVVTLVVVPRSSGSYPNISALLEQGDSALLSNALVS
jgi:hypothetical protein